MSFDIFLLRARRRSPFIPYGENDRNRNHAAGLRLAQRDTSKRVAIARLDKLARLFDTAFILPGTNIRFGVEAVIRLLHGIGDAAASALSCYLLYEAHRLDVPKHVFARMVANVAIDAVVGAVPLLGDLFDGGFRANRRNVKILQEYFEWEGLL